MESRDALFTILAVVAGVFVVSQATASIGDETTDSSGNVITTDPYLTQDTTIMQPTTEQKINAFIRMIYQLESNGRYDSLVGGRFFTDYSHHPAQLGYKSPAGWTTNAAGTNYYNPAMNSSAAGAGQFIYGTWDGLRNALGLPDFTPASQDAAMQLLLQQIGAIDAITNDDIDGALRLASAQWASLPYATAGQHPKSLAVAMNTYNNFLG